jgi:DNA polymerase-1
MSDEVTLVIDGDEIAYHFAYRNTNLERMYSEIDQHLTSIFEYLHADRISYIALSPHRSESFRRKLFPGYKAHRDKREPPPLLKAARDYIMMFPEAIQWGRLEADDILGLFTTPNTIRVTQDKDSATIPGKWFNPRTMELKDVSQEEAFYALLKQTLMGDSADGYKGVPGIGPKKADKILGGTTHRGIQKVYRAFLKAGLTREDLWLNYRMAKILTHKEIWDKEKRIVIKRRRSS